MVYNLFYSLHFCENNNKHVSLDNFILWINCDFIDNCRIYQLLQLIIHANNSINWLNTTYKFLCTEDCYSRIYFLRHNSCLFMVDIIRWTSLSSVFSHDRLYYTNAIYVYMCAACMVHKTPHALIINLRGLVVRKRGTNTSAPHFIVLTRLRTFGRALRDTATRQIAGNLETSKLRALFCVSCSTPTGSENSGGWFIVGSLRSRIALFLCDVCMIMQLCSEVAHTRICNALRVRTAHAVRACKSRARMYALAWMEPYVKFHILCKVRGKLLVLTGCLFRWVCGCARSETIAWRDLWWMQRIKCVCMMKCMIIAVLIGLDVIASL